MARNGSRAGNGIAAAPHNGSNSREGPQSHNSVTVKLTDAMRGNILRGRENIARGRLTSEAAFKTFRQSFRKVQLTFEQFQTIPC